MDKNNQFKKDQAAILDYTWDWKALTNGTGSSDYLAAGETISSFTVTAQSGLTVSSTTSTASTVTAWISAGGDLGATYKVTCKIVTSNPTPRTDERSIYITIQNL